MSYDISWVFLSSPLSFSHCPSSSSCWWPSLSKQVADVRDLERVCYLKKRVSSKNEWKKRKRKHTKCPKRRRTTSLWRFSCYTSRYPAITCHHCPYGRRHKKRRWQISMYLKRVSNKKKWNEVIKKILNAKRCCTMSLAFSLSPLSFSNCPSLLSLNDVVAVVVVKCKQMCDVAGK